MTERIVPRHPYKMPAEQYTCRAEKRKWYFHITLDNKRPCAVFVHTNARSSDIPLLHDAIDAFISLAQTNKIEQRFIDSQIEKSKYQANSARLTRLVSLCLRHKVPLCDVVETLEDLDHNVTNFTWHLCKILGSYLENEDINQKCPNCGQKALVRENGCKTCQACAWAACG